MFFILGFIKTVILYIIVYIYPLQPTWCSKIPLRGCASVVHSYLCIIIHSTGEHTSAYSVIVQSMDTWIGSIFCCYEQCLDKDSCTCVPGHMHRVRIPEESTSCKWTWECSVLQDEASCCPRALYFDSSSRMWG